MKKLQIEIIFILLSLCAHAVVLAPLRPASKSKTLSFKQGKNSFQVSFKTRRPLEIPKRGEIKNERQKSLGKEFAQEDLGTIEAPQKLSLDPPNYPEDSRLYGEEGEVIVTINIGSDKRAHDIRILTSSGHERLDQAVIKKLESTFFTGQKEGEVELSFKFELQ